MSASTAAAAAPPPLALYLHFPWCVRKCPYCDFNSHAVRGELPEQAYVAALLADLDWELRMHPARELVSVYCGGGTPSLFSADAFAELFAGIRARLPLAADVEITVEVNPGTLRAGYFEQLRGLGCNRLSIGVQSFDDGRLRVLGRVHDAAAARATVAAARAAGFDDFNLDLMFGLPGQSPAAALDDVRAALALAPTHLSHYQLTIEPGTVFAARPPRLPAEPAILRAQRACHELLAEHGFAHYEVSAHARRGRESRHNLNYWQFGDYLGIGAGAHAKITDHEGILRLARRKQPQDYLEHAGTPQALAESRRLTSRLFRYI